MMKRWTLLLLALLTMPAQAQQYQEININRISNGGVLAGCSIVFDIGYQDFSYRQGLPSLASGSLNFYLNPKSAYASLKVIGQDFTATATRIGFFQITNAFVEVNGTPYLIDKQSQCENPTGFCAAYGSAKAMELLKAATRTFTVGFNRRANGMDIRLAVALEPKKELEMADCLGALIDQVQRSMN